MRTRRTDLYAAVVSEHGTGPGDESSKDRALTLGLAKETTRAFHVCSGCHGMSWRRHWNGCVGCGLPYQAEHVEHSVPDIQSNAGWAA